MNTPNWTWDPSTTTGGGVFYTSVYTTAGAGVRWTGATEAAWWRELGDAVQRNGGHRLIEWLIRQPQIPDHLRGAMFERYAAHSRLQTMNLDTDAERAMLCYLLAEEAEAGE